MKNVNELRPHREVTRELRPLLPEEAFQPSPRKLVFMVLHLAVVGCGIYAITRSPATFYPLISLTIGHSLACIAFYTHELSHNAIVTNSSVRRPLETFFWALNFIPATMWRQVHNAAHHPNANTPSDPDRKFFVSERSTSTTLYSRLLYPSRGTLRWNPLVLAHFVAYILRNVSAVFYPRSKPSVVPAKPRFTPRQRLAIAGEIGLIFLIRAAIFRAVGQDWVLYVWASPVSALVTSAIVMTYVFTNHFLNPVHDLNDPLASTTSVTVPGVFNKLHANFAYHTEHHVYPSMNSDFYPLVSDKLKELYGDRYHQRPLLEAWKLLWREPDFVDEQPADAPERSTL